MQVSRPVHLPVHVGVSPEASNQAQPAKQIGVRGPGPYLAKSGSVYIFQIKMPKTSGGTRAIPPLRLSLGACSHRRASGSCIRRATSTRSGALASSALPLSVATKRPRGRGDETCLAHIELGPGYAIVKQALTTAWQKFVPLSLGQAEIIRDTFRDVSNARFFFGSKAENRKHQGLVIGYWHLRVHKALKPRIILVPALLYMIVHLAAEVRARRDDTPDCGQSLFKFLLTLRAAV